MSEIDPHYIDKPYVVVPTKYGKKSYALLREVLKRSGKAGIAKLVLRTRQHLCAVIPHARHSHCWYYVSQTSCAGRVISSYRMRT